MDKNSGYVTFSNPVKQKDYINSDKVPYLHALRDYIVENKLGKIDYLEERKNPNTNRIIGLLIWHFDKNKFIKSWDKKFPPKRYEREKLRIIGDSCGHSIAIGHVVTFGRWLLVGQSFIPKGETVYVNLSDVEIVN